MVSLKIVSIGTYHPNMVSTISLKLMNSLNLSRYITWEYDNIALAWQFNVISDLHCSMGCVVFFHGSSLCFWKSCGSGGTTLHHCPQSHVLGTPQKKGTQLSGSAEDLLQLPVFSLQHPLHYWPVEPRSTWIGPQAVCTVRATASDPLLIEAWRFRIPPSPVMTFMTFMTCPSGWTTGDWHNLGHWHTYSWAWCWTYYDDEAGTATGFHLSGEICPYYVAFWNPNWQISVPFLRKHCWEDCWHLCSSIESWWNSSQKMPLRWLALLNLSCFPQTFRVNSEFLF